MLFSALTDMAALLRDPRWSELAHDTVSHVVIMGGLIEAEDGELLARHEPSPSASSRPLTPTLTLTLTLT